MVLENRSAGEIRKVAIGQGMKTLRQDGLRLIWEGLTTLEEVLRVTKDERTIWSENGNGQPGAAPPISPGIPARVPVRRSRATVSPEDVAADSAEENLSRG